MVQVSFSSFILLLQLYACVCLNSGMCTRAHRGPEMLSTMKLELQEVVSCLIWALGTKLKKLQKSPKCHFTLRDFLD